MLKKRSIRVITVNHFASQNQVRYVRRRKNGKIQVRTHRLTDQEHQRLTSRIRHCALHRQGLISVWCNGWSFYPNNLHREVSA